MKQILLLAAIYSLIIHQSNKKAKAPIPTNITRAATFKIDTEKKHVSQTDLIDKTADFVSKNSFTRLSEKE